MKALSFLLILFSASGIAADINCSDGECVYDSSLDVRNESNDVYSTKFEIRDLNEDISIFAPNGSAPRTFVTEIKNQDPEGFNLNINLNSSRKLTPAGSMVIFGESVKNLNISASGRPGDPTDDASKLCAQKIMNGDFGLSVKSKFLLARLNTPTLPADRCVSGDLTSIQNDEFACSLGFQEQNTPNLTATRWVPRKTCEAQSERRMCIQRKMKVNCVWTAERVVGSATTCSNSVPQGDALNHYKPPGPGAGGKQWVCDPSTASSTATGWKLTFDPYIVDESWVQSRRISGKSDEDICDELTGRYDRYFTQNFPEITTSWIGGNLGFNGRGQSYIRKLYWAGKNSKSIIGNPWPNENFSGNVKLLSGLFRTCFSAGSHSEYHTWAAMEQGCPWFGYNAGSFLPWGGYAKFGGKGHTVRYPSGTACYADPANNRMVCNYPLIGEAFSTVHEFKLVFYGPHGRILNMTWQKGVGRY